MIAVVLFICVCVILLFEKEHKMIVDVKITYWKILDMLRKTGDPMWAPLFKPAILTGMTDWNRDKGPIGTNINKGYEIYLCLDNNDTNSAVYILIHELAHMTVSEYDHTDAFWNNFTKLKKLCVSHGLYEMKGNRTYCGDDIQES